jgi:DNA-binding MarR family transcriptional regulator
MRGMSTLGQPASPAPTSVTAPVAEQAAGSLVADTIARLRRAARAADPGNPLSVAQLELLSAVADEPGVRPGRLARRLRLAPNSVTTLVNGLHTKGLITRSTTTADARAVVLALTDAGQRAVETWKAANAAIVHTALGVLGPHQHHALAEALPALRALTQAIDEIADAAVPDDGHAPPRT